MRSSALALQRLSRRISALHKRRTIQDYLRGSEPFLSLFLSLMLVYTGDIDGWRAKGRHILGRPLERLQPKNPAFLISGRILPPYLPNTHLPAFVPWNFVFSDEPNQTDPGPVTKGETPPPPPSLPPRCSRYSVFFAYVCTHSTSISTSIRFRMSVSMLRKTRVPGREGEGARLSETKH